MKNEEQDARVDHSQYDPLPLVAEPLATASENDPRVPRIVLAEEPEDRAIRLAMDALENDDATPKQRREAHEALLDAFYGFAIDE